MKPIASFLPWLAAASLVTACSGAGSMSAPISRIGSQASQLFGITFTGTNVLSRLRSPMSLNGTPVTAAFNGTVVGTGTLDGNGHAVITFTSSVPRGATLTITAGATTITVVLSQSLPATTVLVTVQSNGTLVVESSGDPTGTGNAAPSMGANDAEQLDEDGSGNVLDIDNPAGTTLPANLPITIVAACGGILISPNASGVASIRVREQIDDENNNDDSNAELDFRGAFTGPLSFPIVSSAARLRVEVFSQPNEQGTEVLEVRAPISAVTAQSTPPSACPSPAATGLPNPTPTPTASM